MLCAAAKGFVYAVTMTGTTGQGVAVPDEVLAYMDRVKSCSHGSGVRRLRHPLARQVARFARHVDGVVVGSALVEALERGEDVGAFLAIAALRARSRPA